MPAADQRHPGACEELDLSQTQRPGTGGEQDQRDYRGAGNRRSGVHAVRDLQSQVLHQRLFARRIGPGGQLFLRHQVGDRQFVAKAQEDPAVRR